jgi:hypothetical protein
LQKELFSAKLQKYGLFPFRQTQTWVNRRFFTPPVILARRRATFGRANHGVAGFTIFFSV